MSFSSIFALSSSDAFFMSICERSTLTTAFASAVFASIVGAAQNHAFALPKPADFGAGVDHVCVTAFAPNPDLHALLFTF